ncbi:MAG: InlB B-repeat-containing protein [Clostridiales bacterium]|jgi:uncharacterized repeat protein (TIGR02543 family)|nr:InlB B-repeat-containing protein [Clostridiales bacterium]
MSDKKTPIKSKTAATAAKPGRSKAAKKAVKKKELTEKKKLKEAARAKAAAEKKKLKAQKKQKRMNKKYPPVPPRNTTLTAFISALILVSLFIVAFFFFNPYAKLGFDANGGSAVSDTVVRKGSPVDEPPPPVKTGYIFDGWYTDADLQNQFDFSEGVYDSLVIYAKWTPAHYALNTELNGGAFSSDAEFPFSYTVEDEIILPVADEITKNGYIFGGWYTDRDFTAGTEIAVIAKGTTGHIYIYAKWTAA